MRDAVRCRGVPQVAPHPPRAAGRERAGAGGGRRALAGCDPQLGGDGSQERVTTGEAAGGAGADGDQVPVGGEEAEAAEEEEEEAVPLEEAEEEDEELLEDASELGEDEDDMAEVIENVEDEEER